jgi:hypothetical protein
MPRRKGSKNKNKEYESAGLVALAPNNEGKETATVVAEESESVHVPYRKITDPSKPGGELFHSSVIPPKPRDKGEVRLYEVTTKGKGNIMNPFTGQTQVGAVVTGTKKAWLNKEEATRLGHYWNPKPQKPHAGISVPDYFR